LLVAHEIQAIGVFVEAEEERGNGLVVKLDVEQGLSLAEAVALGTGIAPFQRGDQLRRFLA
jgi:hypothetical protein